MFNLLKHYNTVKSKQSKNYTLKVTKQHKHWVGGGEDVVLLFFIHIASNISSVPYCLPVAIDVLSEGRIHCHVQNNASAVGKCDNTKTNVQPCWKTSGLQATNR